MTLEEKVGQMMVFGFPNRRFDSHLKHRLQKVRPGGLIIFSRNIQSHQQLFQLNKKTQAFSQKLTGLPLFIMVDQEGGNVSRIKLNPNAPSALALANAQDNKIVRESGYLTGRILSLLGFNMNLAPVLDLSNPDDDSFIGNRSFGNDPEAVKYSGEAFSSGLLEAGIIPTAKHFPGHGGIATDSHKSLPAKFESLDQLKRFSLIPFNWFAQVQYPSAIMVAHMSLPQLDPSGTPATFSKIIVNELLRKELNYEGLVITDDVEMAAASKAGSIGERAIRAIEAGCDLIMIAWTVTSQLSAYKKVLAAARSGRLSMARIDESLVRILTAKLTWAKMRPKETPQGNFSEELLTSITKYRSLTSKIDQNSFQREMESAPKWLLEANENKKAIVFTADPKFFREFRKHWGSNSHLKLLQPGRDPQIYQNLDRYPNALAIYYATGTGTVTILNGLSPKTKLRLLVINTTNPGRIVNPSSYLALINLNSRNFLSGAWLAEALKLRQAKPAQLDFPGGKGSTAPPEARWLFSTSKQGVI